MGARLSQATSPAVGGADATQRVPRGSPRKARGGGDGAPPYGSSLAGRAADRYDIQAVATHEVGHVIGLGHVSPRRAIRLTMFRGAFIADKGPQTLGCGDRLGVNELYSPSPLLNCTTPPVPND